MLIRCVECGREGVSALAPACPGCGAPPVNAWPPRGPISEPSNRDRDRPRGSSVPARAVQACGLLVMIGSLLVLVIAYGERRERLFPRRVDSELVLTAALGLLGGAATYVVSRAIMR